MVRACMYEQILQLYPDERRKKKGKEALPFLRSSSAFNLWLSGISPSPSIRWTMECRYAGMGRDSGSTPSVERVNQARDTDSIPFDWLFWYHSISRVHVRHRTCLKNNTAKKINTLNFSCKMHFNETIYGENMQSGQNIHITIMVQLLQRWRFTSRKTRRMMVRPPEIA